MDDALRTLIWLALAPSLFAAFLLSKHWRRAPLARVVQVASVAIAAVASFLIVKEVGWMRPAQVVVLSDEDDPALRRVQVKSALSALQQQVSWFTIGILRGPGVVPAKGEVCGTWLPGGDLPGDGGRSDSSAVALVRWAVDRFAESCPGDARAGGLWQRLSAPTRRVVIAMAHPPKWSALTIQAPRQPGADSRSTLAKLAAEAIARGVSVDLIAIKAPQDAVRRVRPLKLSVTTPTWLPANVTYTDATIGLHLEGLGPEARSISTWRRRCEIDPGRRGASFPLNETDITVKHVEDELVEDGIPLRGFFDDDATNRAYSAASVLAPGFHLIRCSVTLMVDGRQQVIDGSAYGRATAGSVLVVAGHGKRFQSDSSRAWSTSHELQDQWTKVPHWQPRNFDSVRFDDRDWIDEAELCGRLEAALNATAPTRLPPFIVLLDVADEAFEQQSCQQALEQSIERGTHVWFAGAPGKKLAEKLKSVPAYAEQDEHGAEFRYDRRPRLAFVRDRSRLGRLTHKPPKFDPGTPSSYLIKDDRLSTLELASGERLQQQIVEGVAGPIGGRGGRGPLPFPIVEVPPTAAEQEPERDGEMWSASQLDARLDALQLARRGRTRATEIWTGDVVVVFSYELKQRAASADRLRRLLEQGATVLIVTIRTPHTGAVNLAADGGSLPDVAALVRAAKAQTQTGGPLREQDIRGRLLDAGTLEISENRMPDVSSVVSKISSVLAPRLDPRSRLILPQRFGRLIDERVGVALPASASVAQLSRLGDGERWAAPVFSQSLHVLGNPLSDVYASSLDAPNVGERLAARPLLVAGVWGQGQVVVSGYSPLEGASEDRPFGPNQSLKSPNQRIFFAPIYPDQRHDYWGPQRLLEFTGFSSTLEPAPSAKPVLLGVERQNDSSPLDLTVLQSAFGTGGLEDVVLRRCEINEHGDPTGCRATDVRPVLQALDPVRQQLTYSVLPTALRRACPDSDRGCLVQLARPDAAPAYGSESESIYALNYLVGPEAPPASVDLRPQQAAAALSRYSGGEAAEVASKTLAGIPLRTREWGALGAFASACILWSTRLGRRLAAAKALARAGQRSRVGRRLSSGADVGVEHGAVSGRPVATKAVGAAAGMRSMEPGDRLQSASTEDMLLMLSGQSGVPRVRQHIDEKSLLVNLVVHAGSSMRLAAVGADVPAKLRAAIGTAEILAHHAWQTGAEVRLVLVGVGDQPKTLGPFFASPGAGSFLRSADDADCRARACAAPLVLKEDDSEPVPGVLVIISDFLNDDHPALERFARRAEQAGTRFAAVCVYSSVEFLLTDMAEMPPNGAVFDRSEWTSGDLAYLHARLVDRLRDHFDDTHGGLTVVNADWSSDDLMTALCDTPILELLR